MSKIINCKNNSNKHNGGNAVNGLVWRQKKFSKILLLYNDNNYMNNLKFYDMLNMSC